MGAKTEIKLSNKTIDVTKPIVMAILNVTPDSFFEGSRFNTQNAIAERVRQIIDEGAAIIDVGGYSSRPGAEDVSASQEYERVIEAVQIITEIAPDMPISLDTFRSDVAQKVIAKVGDCIVNDISAGELDTDMMRIVGEMRVPYIAMHMRGTPQNMQTQTSYEDINDEIKKYFEAKINQAQRAGIEDIILDPGFGFSKSVEQNYEVLGKMSELLKFGMPVLAGVSRKSMICRVLGISPSEALCGTIALNWECLRQGATILRVHDVREAVQVVRLFEKI